MNLGSYECDDGNIVDGDGCDHECKKEVNAICSGDASQKDSCKFPSYKIVFTEGMYKANVIFNFPVENMNSYINGLKATIKLANGTLVTVPVSSSGIINDTAMSIDLNMDNIETSENDEFELLLPEFAKQANGSSYLTTDKLKEKTIPNAMVKESIVTKSLIYAAYGICAVGLVLMSVTKNNPNVVWDLIESLQIISIMLLIEIKKIPQYLFGALNGCAVATFSFIPKFLAGVLSLDSSFKESYVKASKHPLLEGYNIINNFGPITVMILAIVGVYFIVKAAAKAKSMQIRSIMLRATKQFQYGIFIRVTMLCEIPLLICIMASLREVGYALSSGVTNLVSFGVTILELGIYAIWFLLLIIFVRKNRVFFNDSAYKLKFGEIYDRFRYSGKAPYTTLILMAKQILCTLIILMASIPLMQNIFYILGVALLEIWSLIIRPYNTRLENLSQIVSDGLLLATQITYSLLRNTNIMVWNIATVDIITTILLLASVYARVMVVIVRCVSILMKATKKPFNDQSILNMKGDTGGQMDMRISTMKETTRDNGIEFRTSRVKQTRKIKL